MPRFSEKAMEVFDAIWFYADIRKAENLIQNLNAPEEIAFGKLFSAFYYVYFSAQIKSLSLIDEAETVIQNNDIDDQFVLFFFHSLSFYINSGWERPPINKELSDMHLDKTRQILQEFEAVDDWESKFVEGWYYNALAYYEWKFNHAIPEAIKIQRKGVKLWLDISEVDGDFAAFGINHLGFYLRVNGDFEEAEEVLLQVLKICQKYNSLFQFAPLMNLSEMNSVKGNLQVAKKYCRRLIDLGKQYEEEPGGKIRLGWALSVKSNFLYADGNYSVSLKLRHDILDLYKQTNEPWRIFSGILSILEFHNSRYTATKEEKSFEEAEKVYKELLDFSSQYPENQTMQNFSEIAQALILKHGNIRKKGKAMDILEKQTENYPNNIAISFRLLELLFDDVVLTGDKDVINQIDEIIIKIGKIPLRKNPLAIGHYVSQMVMIAKYNYYIKGDISGALETLHSAKNHMNNYKLNNLSNYIGREIALLEGEITKWDKLDISIKERIKKSQFNKYVQEALEFAAKQ